MNEGAEDHFDEDDDEDCDDCHDNEMDADWRWGWWKLLDDDESFINVYL